MTQVGTKVASKNNLAQWPLSPQTSNQPTAMTHTAAHRPNAPLEGFPTSCFVPRIFLTLLVLSWELFLTPYRNIEYLVFNMAFLSHLRAIVARSLYFCICICVFGAAHCCNGSFLSHLWASIVRSPAHPVVQLKVKLLPNLLSPT